MTETDVRLLQSEVPTLMLGTLFTFFGLAAFAVAAIRRRRELLVLLWAGCFIGMYGVRMLAQAFRSLSLVPNSPWLNRIDVFVTYFLLIPGILFWVELSIGTLRRLLWLATLFAFAVGIIGLGYFVRTGSLDKALPLNHLLAILMLVMVGAIVAVPRLSKTFLLIQSRVVALYLPTVAVVSVYYNLSGLLHVKPSWNVEPAAFVVWILALGYIAAERVFANERRLLAIEHELQTAREIQASILPSSAPAVTNLRIAAAYEPMSAVAGDFYHFITQDEHRVGVLVADVTGHGVPAALVSSMIKVAMQSVAEHAAEPSRVLAELNRILSPDLRGQLISAAYLWIDSEHRCARYSAAGHPPLLYWRHSRGELQRIECNGLLFGVAQQAEYPAISLAFQSQDRLLLYTDGVIEPENGAGEPFGERRLADIVSAQSSRPGAELSQTLLSELRRWPSSASLPDDVTLIVIDVM